MDLHVICHPIRPFLLLGPNVSCHRNCHNIKPAHLLTLTLTKFVNDIVPTVNIKKENVSDLRDEDFDKINSEIEAMSRTISGNFFNDWNEITP